MSDNNFAVQGNIRVQQIAALNDAMRAEINYPTGNNHIVMTTVVAAIVGDTAKWTGFKRMREVFRLVRDHDASADEHNPFHDAGDFEWNGHRLFWKIDCFDLTGNYMSENPSDPAKTKRVLTIGHTEEW